MNCIRRIACILFVCAGWLLVPSLLLPATGLAAEKPAPPVVVLDTTGFWRIHHTLRPPVIQTDSGLKSCILKMPWVDRDTGAPSADWNQPEFDDHRWPRNVARMTCLTPYLAKLCLRGKFLVSDPAKAQDLRISLGYHGGAIVYINGKEAVRSNVSNDSNLAERQVTSPSGPLAEPYPPESFLFNDGSLMTYWKGLSIRSGNPLFEMRNREIKDAVIPSSLLRPGVNLVAVEIVRSPYPKVVDEKKDPKKNYWNFAWNTCQLNAIRVTATAADGLEPNATRPEGFQVWNNSLLAGDFDLAYGDRAERLFPIELAGARNGAFSGRVMVGSAKPIHGLMATAGDLKGPSGVIPAGQIRIRYAIGWGYDYIVQRITNRDWVEGLLSCLCDKPPDEIPVRKREAWGPRMPNQPQPIAGAVTAVWVTVKVPKDAQPGQYAGHVSIAADGEKPIAVPVQLEVADWTLPDPQHYQTWMEILQSPETLAAEYEVPMWSERHWDLVAQSFRLVSDSGSRVAYVPLIAETNFGHQESMVRWVRKDDGSYSYDFSLMDKYLDVAEKNLGPLKMVVFPVWEVYMVQQDQYQGRPYHKEFMEKNNRFIGKGPVVTLWNKADGKTENIGLPAYADPASQALWKPLFDQLRARIAKRGSGIKTLVGMMNDACPSKDELAFFADIAPDFPWVVHAHGVYTKTNVGYQCTVWGCKHAEEKSLLGWKRPDLSAMFNRDPSLDTCPNSEWRNRCEFAITGDTRGTGRIGADFWKVFKNKNGQRSAYVYNRYPQSNWRNLDIYTSVLAPGPDGLGATNRYEMLREGLQECEARIAVERALTDDKFKGKLGPELVARCEKALEQRLRALQLGYSGLNNRLEENPAYLSNLSGGCVAGHLWYLNSGWEDRAREIFVLAGEVEKQLAVK